MGKTIFTSIVIDDLTTRFHDNPDIGIAYIYCNFRRWDEQKAGDLLASLLKQLSQGRSSLPAHVKALYEKHKDKRTRPSFDEISGALHWVSAMYSKVIIIVDALDECQPSDGCQLLSHIFSLQADNAVSFFATSRPIPDIEGYFKECLRLEIIASDEDVRRYVHGHMSHLPKFVCNRPDIQEEIEAEIAGAVEGMYGFFLAQKDQDPPLTLTRFLLAQLYLDSLKDKTSVTEMKSALKKFRKQSQQGPGEDGKRDVLEQAYDQAVERIDSQMTGFRLLGRKTLSWICCAKRPLTTYELQHALAVKTGDTELDKDNLRGIEDVVSVCAGLVTVDEESNILRLVHHTAQKYFERAQKVWLQDAETEITTACVTYLSFNTFERGPCVTDEEFEQRLQQNSLYGYAARNWGHHARRASPLVHELILGFVESEAKVSASSQAMLASKLFGGDSGYAQRVPKQITCVHLAASFGLLETMIYLQSRHSLDVRDSRGRTPLSLAAENGHEAVVDVFLEKEGVDINTKDSQYRRTPLSWAAGNGHHAVVELLLAKGGIEPDSEDRDNRTPLSWAAGNGHDSVVKLLLGNDRVVPDSKAAWFHRGRTPLSWAAVNGHEAVVKLLLKTGEVDPDATDDDRRSPLSHAAQHGHEAVVKLLLATGTVASDSKDSHNWTPLWWALKNGNLRVLEALLVNGHANPDAKNIYGQTPLLWAVDNRQEAVAKLLLEKGVDLEVKDSNGLTALCLAARNGDKAMIKLLLGHNGVDVNSDGVGRTLLLSAVDSRDMAMVKLLLEKDVDLETKDNDDPTPLCLAINNRDEAVVKLLLKKDINLEVKDHNGYTPLLQAVMKGHEVVVKLLLKKGVDLEVQDSDGCTALWWAVENRNEAVVMLLLENGVNLEVKDSNGNTPLLRAVRNGGEAVVKLLLENGADMEAKDDDFGFTPLFWAIDQRYETVVKLLLERGADVEAKDDAFGFTPLLWVVSNGDEMLTKLLLENGANLEPKDNNGLTPLSLAALRGDEGVIKLLLEKDVDLEAKDNHGLTPLFLAVHSNNAGVVKILLEKGVDLEVKDSNGYTALGWALEKGYAEVVKLLQTELQ